jgi:hypothetical protein
MHPSLSDLQLPLGGNGAPLASIQPEAASLLNLLRYIAVSPGQQTPILIFVGCLSILNFLRKLGRHDFHPNPKEVVHFDVIFSLLTELLQWNGSITLMKIKSHACCLMNKQADELAAESRTADLEELCPCPQKYGSFWLQIQPIVC